MIDLVALSLRDFILIAATLVGGYVLLLLLPLLRIRSKSRQPSAAGRQMDERALRSEPVLAGEAQHRTRRHGLSGLPDHDVNDEPNSAPTPGFAHELAQSSLDLDVRRMRRDMEAMRAELDSMAEEMRQLKATRNVAPIYSEAMMLAQHGEAPAGIAAQCGISIGEAELVAALARSGKGGGFDDKDDERYRGAGR